VSTADPREHRAADEAGSLPTFFVAGAMKSATSSLAAWLGAHPDVHIPPNKEVRFFDEDRSWALGEAWYRAAFAGAGDATAIGDASPSYMFHRGAPSRMASLVPGARLVVCLRDPVERAHSHFWHNHALGIEQRPLERALTAELDGAEPPWSHPGFLWRGRYLPQLERLLAHYDRGSLLVLLTDDLERHPIDAYRAAATHIGVDASYVPDVVGTTVNPASDFRAPRVFHAMSRHRLWRWIPAPIRPRVGRAFRRRREYPPLPADLRDRLRAWFAPDDEALASWLGRDLPWRA
jgi:hypothetical protein